MSCLSDHFKFMVYKSNCKLPVLDCTVDVRLFDGSWNRESGSRKEKLPFENGGYAGVTQRKHVQLPLFSGSMQSTEIIQVPRAAYNIHSILMADTPIQTLVD